jgi:retron-type reverse transcriptase
MFANDGMSITYRDLWNGFISRENFDLALKRAVEHKKSKPEIARFLAGDPEARLEELRQSVICGEFRTSAYRPITIFEPKKRVIYVLPFYPDRIMHHALMNILVPIWDGMFIRDSFACRPNMGVHAASKRAMHFVRNNKYCLQCDIRRFYPSINHQILFKILGRKIRDERILALLKDIVFSIEAHTDDTPLQSGSYGVPIGNLCSQWFGNLYMNDLDMFVKHKLRCKSYIRYCDDFCLFSDDREQLSRWRDQMRVFLLEELHLIYSYAEIFPVKNGLDFLGYRHFPEFVLVRKTTAQRIKKRMMKIRAYDMRDPWQRGQVASAHGWLCHANAHNLHNAIFSHIKII